MRDKKQGPKRERRVRRSKDTPSPKIMQKKLSVVAVSVALSLGVAYPVFAANEQAKDQAAVNPSPFSAQNLGSTSSPTGATPPFNGGTTVSGNTATKPSGESVTGSTTPGGVTVPKPDGTAKLPQSGVANEGGNIVFDPSESVITNAQSCAERRTEIVKENTEIAIETAGTVFDVDDFFTKVKGSGCLVSVQDSISLANQITSLSGGSISSLIMSQVKSKIADASQQMRDKLFAKGCEVMLEASQNVYGPIDELVGKYGIYNDPDYVGDILTGMIQKGTDNAIFNFDAKIDKIKADILERDKDKPASGNSGGSGTLFPEEGGSLGNASPSTNIDDAQKAAAAQTVIDLAQSRNYLEYPMFTRGVRNNYNDNDNRGRIYTYLHTLNTGDSNNINRQGTEINSEASNDVGRRGFTTNNDIAACTYLAQVSTINNEIRRLSASMGVQDTSGSAINPVNVRSGFWNGANNHIKAAVRNNSECSQGVITPTQTASAPDYGSGGNSGYDVGSIRPDSRAPAVTYGGPTAPQSAPRAATPAPRAAAPVSVAPSTNEATQYMQQQQGDNQQSQETPPPAPQSAPSSNPFNKMKNLFN